MKKLGEIYAFQKDKAHTHFHGLIEARYAVRGKGSLNHSGSPKLDSVLVMSGLLLKVCQEALTAPWFVAHILLHML